MHIYSYILQHANFRIGTKAYCLFTSSPSINKFTYVMAEKYRRITEVYNKLKYKLLHSYINKHTARLLTCW